MKDVALMATSKIVVRENVMNGVHPNQWETICNSFVGVSNTRRYPP
jgi:hypothetical protein